MKTYLFVLLWFLIQRKLLAAESNNLELDVYLQEQSRILYEHLIRQIRSIREIDKRSEGPEILGYYKSKSNESLYHHIFTFFNKTFFVMGDEIFLGTLGKNFDMVLYGNFKHRSTIFLKTFEYKHTGFMVLSTKNEIFMYSFVENRTSQLLIQTISTPYSSDGIFFVNTDSLYFVSISNPIEHIGHIRVYKWLGSHFDEIEKIYATGIVKMNSFPYQNSEIIIFGRKLPNILKAHSSVYKFKEDRLKSIQQLEIDAPTHMDIFFQNSVPYVLIYEELNTQKLYKWNGFEMVLVNRFQWEHKVDKSIVVYSNTIPLIVQPQLDKVLIFKPQNDDIQQHQTKNYLENNSAILDLNIRENENVNITFIVALNEDNIINIYGMSFKAHAVMEREQEDTLQKCFNNLHLKVYDRRNKLNQTGNGRVEVPVVDTLVSNSRNRKDVSNSIIDDTNIEYKLANIKNRLNNLRPFIMKHGGSTNELVVNGKAVIKGNIVVKKVKAKKIKFMSANGKSWTPKRWLRYSQEQTIKGPVQIKKLNTKVLATKGNAGRLFQNILRHNGNQTISGNYKIKNLFASKIISKQINNIEVDNIYKQSDASRIKGRKSFKNIFTKKADIKKINGNKTEDILRKLQAKDLKENIKFARHVKVDTLVVETIDNINWDEFEKSVFKIGEDDIIEGNFSVPQIDTKELHVKNINGINTNDIMTTSTDQVVNSTIQFDNINASNIECGTINGVDITKAVQVDQNGTIIKGPVRIHEINVLNDLELVGPVDKSLFLKEGDHLFSTNESDLVQRYLGKVIVDGNLYVKDFSVLLNTTIFFKGNKYSLDVLDEFWNKNGNQTIPVHFEVKNGISTPHLKTKSLNDVPVEKFAINSKETQIKNPLFFENVIVEGNVILKGDNANNNLDLQKLLLFGVKNNGKTYNIHGRKVFNNTLVAKHLIIEKSKQNNENAVIPGIKIFKEVLVKGDLVANISADVINNINITKYLGNLLPINKSQNLTDMTLKNLTAEKLYVKTINGIRVGEYLEKLHLLLGKRQIEKVNIKGNLTMERVRDLKTINGHNIEKFLKKNISRTNEDSDLIGDVKYTGKIKLGHLRANVINGISFPDLTRRVLYKKSNQTVTGTYTFTDLKTVHLYVQYINEKNVGDLIDISSTELQQLAALNGIIFNNIKLEKSVTAREMVPCDINKAMQNIRYPESQKWALVEIFGNVTFLDENCDLIKILEKSVKTDQENIITAPVAIKGHVLAEQVQSKSDLNGINLSELIEDIVLIDSEDEQIITGHKILKNVVKANKVNVTENADIPIVNNIYMRELYKNIIKKEQLNNTTILGKKIFLGGLQSDRFLTESIGGIKPEDIVSLTNLSQIPSALFDSIRVLNDLNVQFINNYDLDYVLNNRLLINTTEKQITNAVYFFNELEMLDDLETTSINNIQIDNIVFDDEKQKITAPKIFTKNITISGNAQIEYLNGINITKSYDDAVLHGKEKVINGSITVLKPVRLEGNITAHTLNGYPIEQIKKIMNRTSDKAEEAIILNAKEKLKTIIHESLPVVKHMPNEFMYIERSTDLQVIIPKTINARVTVIKDYALMHILSEESHEKCNLPKGCKCPIQYTVEITPQHSVSSFLNKQQQRIYSYDDDTMTIHLFTNTVSTDIECRTNEVEQLNETSNMAWTSTTKGNTTGTFNAYPLHFTGYVSGAEFFTLNGITYAVIARYYDAVTNTHDLDCTVIRFNNEKARVSEIQKIPTHGAWTLYLLHTAQGITIVIGNLETKRYTEIYRFNEQKEQFELLRSVPYGCTKAVGVVLGTDSFIILANNNAPLKILKYQVNWDNYYYYQMFAFDEPVLGMSVFYIGGFGISEAYLCIVTEENYRIYNFQYIDGWKLETSGVIRGLRNLIPFELNNQLYLFAPSTGESSLLTVVKHGA